MAGELTLGQIDHMVDRVYGKVSELYQSMAITDGEWRWAKHKFPAFWCRILELEEEANPSLVKDEFWNKVDRWGRNHLFLFEQIKNQRTSFEGIPELTDDDVARALADYRAQPKPPPTGDPAPSGRKPASGGRSVRGGTRSARRARSATGGQAAAAGA